MRMSYQPNPVIVQQHLVYRGDYLVEYVDFLAATHGEGEGPHSLGRSAECGCHRNLTRSRAASFTW